MCPLLRSLLLPGNRISDIKNVAGLAELSVLDLSRNSIEVTLPQVLLTVLP